MPKIPCIRNENDDVQMTAENLKICVSNAEGYQDPALNEVLYLQICGFVNMANLAPFKNVHTIFLTTNVVEKISGLESLPRLTSLYMRQNRIKKIEGLRKSKNLKVLDLTNNLIESLSATELEPLKSLTEFKLANNRLSSFQSIAGLSAVLRTLTLLDISENEITYDPGFLRLLARAKLTLLVTTKTKISQGLPHARKEMLAACPSLKFLDEEQVSADDIALAKAWKRGGLEQERKVRGAVNQKKIDKQASIYQEIESRNNRVDLMRKTVHSKKTRREQDMLQQLRKKRYSSLLTKLSRSETLILELQIKDLETYISLMMTAMEDVNLEQELGLAEKVPAMVIDKVTPEAIYVYNVEEVQLPLIAKKFYPKEKRPLIAVNYKAAEQSRWVHHYEQLLKDSYQQAEGKMDKTVALFNLALYDFDQKHCRKVRRFEEGELSVQLKKMGVTLKKVQHDSEDLFDGLVFS